MSCLLSTVVADGIPCFFFERFKICRLWDCSALQAGEEREDAAAAVVGGAVIAVVCVRSLKNYRDFGEWDQ